MSTKNNVNLGAKSSITLERRRFKILTYCIEVGHSDCDEELYSCGQNKSHTLEFHLIINTITFKY